MLKINLFILILYSLGSLAFAGPQKHCFEISDKIGKKTISVEEKKDSFYTLKIIGATGMELDVFCSKKEKEDELNCSGDDDSAQFKMNLKTLKIKVSHMTFGEPDSETKTFGFQDDAKSFSLSSCPK